MDKHSTMTAVDLVRAIDSADLTAHDVRMLNEALRRAFDRVQGAVRTRLYVGQPVQFKGPDGEVLRGKVKRVLRVNVEVIIGSTAAEMKTWRVSPQLVSPL